MPEIKAQRIENKRQDDITKELVLDYKNFEKYDWYNRETAELWKKHLYNMRMKLNNSREKIINYNELIKKFPSKLNEFTNAYNKYEKQIDDYTKNLGNRDYIRRHKETLNKLWSIIDNYENEVIKLIEDLVEDIWDDKVINEEKWKVETANKKVKYVEIWEDWIYKLTKATNRPKIHQVLWDVLSPWEVRKIDYSQCTNSSIKTRMINAISSSYHENTGEAASCYLQYDQEQKTYVLSDWDWHVLAQRALIREWVKLTPPSKIRWEAKIAKKQAEQAQIEKINNVNLTKQEQQDLFDSMPEKLRKRLKEEDRDNFFQITESSINEAIKQAKLEWYELQSPPVWKRGWKDYYVTLNLRNAGSKAEIKRPFIEKAKLKKYWIEDDNKFKNYISQRVSAKRNSFDYLTKKWSTINEKDYWVWNELKENEKEFAIKWLQMLWNRADAVLEKIWNTKIKDDDIEFTALKTYTRDVINDIETWKFTDTNMENIKNKITSMLKIFFKHNRLRSSMQINENEIKWCIDNILSSWNKKSQIIAMRKLWVSRTWFDNSQTAFLRDEIFEEYWRVPKKDENWNILEDEDWNIIYEEWIVDLKKDDYEKYFERINELYSVNPEEDIWEDGEVKEPKKSNIDALYNAARTKWKHSVKNFKKWLVEKWLIPNWRWHWWQIDDKIRALKSQLEQQEKNANKFKITWQEIKERTRQQLAELQLNLTSSQIKKAEQEEWNNDENIAMLNWLNFMLQQDDSFFQELAENETKNTIKSIKYCWVDGVVRWNLAPYLIRRWWWINSNDEIAKIYNDSVWAWWFFDFSDEWSERVWPILKEIIIEVVVTAVSILLCWNGAWEAIYTAFRAAKSLTKWLKWIKKLWNFFKAFNTSLFRTWGKQFVWKFAIKGAKWAKTVTQVSHIATSTEKWIKLTQKVKNTIQIIKKTETLGSLAWKLAMKWWSMIIEWTTFHISSTFIHNAINWEDLWEWLIPRWYTEWPDWEKIPNWQSYAQSIAFLGVLKATWKMIGEVNGRIAELVTKDSYTPSMVNKIFSRSLWLGWEMWWMMLTDQILSLTFDQSLKPISWEELISMFGMVVWLRLNWKFQMKIKEHALRQSTIQMTQEWTWNIFNVRIDKEWNILKVEWVDKKWNKIKNPEQVCWLKAGEYWMNMRDISSVMWDKTWTIEWGKNSGKNLRKLNAWDEITVTHWENNIKLKKTPEWKREVSDSGWSSFEKWTKFDVEQNPNDKSYHLKNSEWGWIISLDWKIDVRLQSRYWNERVKRNEKSKNKKWDKPSQIDKEEGNKTPEEKIKEMEIKTEEIWFKVKEKEKEVAELREEINAEWKNATPEMKEALNKAIKELEIEEAKYELSKAETEYEKIKKEIEEQKFKMWGESTEWDWSQLWDEIIKRLENELIMKEEAIKHAKEKFNKLSGWHKEKAQEAKPSQENDTETPQQKIQKLKEKSSKIEKEQAELKAQTETLEKELKKMKKNKKIEIDWQEVEVTQDIIDATERQIKNNKEKITKNEKALKENKEKINEQRIELEKSKWWIVNIEQDGTISILKSDFSMEKILPDGTTCQWDFDINWNLISWLKVYPDWSREYWTYNEKWEMIFWVKEIKLQEWWFKQTYMTIDWIYEVKLDANKTIVWNMEKIDDWYSVPIPHETAKWIVNWFKEFREEQKARQEQRRAERGQREKEKEARKKILTYKEKKTLKYIIKEVPTLPENISKEYDLWNWEKIRIKKKSNWKFVETKRVIETDEVFLETPIWKEMTEKELEVYLKKRIVEVRLSRWQWKDIANEPVMETKLNFEEFKNIDIANYITIDNSWKISFRQNHIHIKRFWLRNYLDINWKEYRIFENWEWDWIGVMLWSRETTNGFRSWWEYDFQIWNFKNWRLEWKWIRFSRWIKEEWNFKNWRLEWEGKVYQNGQLVYEWEFKNWIYNWKWKEYINWVLVFEWEYKNWIRAYWKEYKKWNIEIENKIYPDWHKEIGIFDESWKLKEWLKITNNWWIKIEIIWEMPWEYIKTQINNLKAEIISNWSAEIKLSTWDIINIISEWNKIYEKISIFTERGQKFRKCVINDLFEYLNTAKKQLNNIKQSINNFENIWIKISEKNIRVLSTCNFKEKDFELFGRIKNLWIEIKRYKLEDLCKLKISDIQNLEKNKTRLENIWININRWNIDKLCTLTDSNILFMEKYHSSLKELGIWNDGMRSSIEKILKLSDNSINNLKMIKNLWIEISATTFDKFINYTETEIKRLYRLKEISWIEINDNNIKDLIKITGEDISNLEKLKSAIEELWFSLKEIIEWWNVKEYSSLELTETEIRNIKNAKSEIDRLWIKLETENKIELINIY